MRKTLALGCCVLYVAFAFVAGAAHVHRASGHHDELRGLHVDHAHLGEATGHGPGGHHHHDRSGSEEVRVERRHVAHHHDDALNLHVAANRALDRTLRPAPAIIVTSATVEVPSIVSLRRTEVSDPLRGPPRRGPLPARAPPA